jgi:hypothetical protein
MGVSQIQKVEWLSAFVAAHDRAVNTQNILSGFRGTGIYPFQPTKVLRRVASSPSPQQQSRPSTPPNPLTAFNEAVLTDSPADFNAVKEANDALNTLIESGARLPSPRKKICRSLHQVNHAPLCTQYHPRTRECGSEGNIAG